MKARAFIALALLAASVAITPLALASPPDETWLGGLWDDDDFDTVVIFLTSKSPAIGPLVAYDASPRSIVVLPVVQIDVRSSSQPPVSSHESRAPPTV